MNLAIMITTKTKLNINTAKVCSKRGDRKGQTYDVNVTMLEYKMLKKSFWKLF
jgi:hypothetical protein